MNGLIKGPVTAVAIWDNVLCAGVGSCIKLFNLHTKQMSFAKQVFRTSIVHGIKTFQEGGNHLVVVLGNKDLQIYQVFKENCPHEGYLQCVFNWRASDWIWDVILLYSDSDREDSSLVATALGHNSVSLVDWKSGVKLKEIHCEEKCIIYSAHFVHEPRTTWKSLALCSGTVFNQVVIWKPSVLNDASTAKVLERIHAHDGVIFNMHFDLHTGRLVTASDDRSIRVWNCGWLTSSKMINVPIFSESKSLCKLYGHESRVWKAQFLQSDIIISIGEDGYCILWKIESSDGDNSFNGSIIKRMKCHKGRNIWSMTVTKGYLATGGGDCGIRFWKISDLIKNKVTITKHPCDDSIENPGAIKSVHICNESIILAHTDHGVLLRYDYPLSEWSVLRSTDNLKSYICVSVCPEAYAIAFGNTKGVVTILMVDDCWKNVMQEKTFDFDSNGGKIHNISWEHGTNSTLLYVSGMNGKFVVYQMASPECSVYEIQTLKLPLAKHRWHMGAISVKQGGTTYVLVGDRRGSLHLYKSGFEEPLYTLHGVHGRDGVTSISRIGESMYSTGRDGIWRKLEICFAEKNIKILMQNRAAPGMGWMMSVVPLNMCHDQIAVLGFHGRNFIVFSSVTGDILFLADCGGGHRDWSFTTMGGDSTLLAFVKESVLYIATAKENVLLENSVLDSHFHAGQITCLKRLAGWKRSSKSFNLLVTCGEDTKVYVSLYKQDTEKDHDNSITKLCLIDGHISNVRAIASMMDEDNEYFSKIILFTGGGRASMHCYLLTVDKTKLSCTAELMCSYSRNKGRSRSDVDPEMRFMDSSVWAEETKILLAVACSDGVIRIFGFDKLARSIFQIAQSHTLSHCLLTVEALLTESKTWILTGGTDGFLRIWSVHIAQDAPSVSQELGLKYHMSGINSLCVMDLDHSQNKNPSKSWLVASGGDDNAIHLTVLEYQNFSFDVLQQHQTEKAHSTQITGLRLIHSQKTEAPRMQLISTSIDQRITRWTILQNSETLTMTLAQSVLTSIADVSALEVWGSNDALCYAVCGQGIEIIHNRIFLNKSVIR